MPNKLHQLQTLKFTITNNNPLTENETIFGLEAGYSYSTPNFSVNVNAYRTSWKDRVVTSSFVGDDDGFIEQDLMYSR